MKKLAALFFAFGLLYASPALAGGQAYVVSNYGSVYALGTPLGPPGFYFSTGLYPPLAYGTMGYGTMGPAAFNNAAAMTSQAMVPGAAAAAMKQSPPTSSPVFRGHDGRSCQFFARTDGATTSPYGMACQNPDGSWQDVL